MQITSKHEQPLLSRIMVQGTIAFDGATPSNAKVSLEIASALKSEPALVVVKRISNSFGQKEALISAVVYKDAQSKSSFEVKTKRMKEADAKAAKESAEKAKAAQEAKNEKPQTDKDENKTENKTPTGEPS